MRELLARLDDILPAVREREASDPEEFPARTVADLYAIGLPQAPFGPRRRVAVGLVHDVAVVVFEAGEPLHQATAVPIGHLGGAGPSERHVDARAGQVDGAPFGLECRREAASHRA